MQRLVFSEKWTGAADVVAQHASELLSDAADAILAEQAVGNIGDERAEAAAVFGLMDRDERPYAERPSCWGPLVLVGA